MKRPKAALEKNSIKYYNNFFNNFFHPLFTALLTTSSVCLTVCRSVCFELYLRICYGSAGLHFQH